jgi:glycosyltransferase involved in cell wall biosynthesis
VTAPTRPSITAIVLTKNEGLHIRRCIESLSPAVQRICIVDSGSHDDTLQIARTLGAEIFENPWINHAAQFNWALDHCGVTTDWVLRIDADEYLEPQLQTELTQRVPVLPGDTHGVLLIRKYYFMRRWVRHGGMHPLYSLRLWRHGTARIENRWMDEHAELLQGGTLRFDGAFVDDNLRDLAWWSKKHVHYATLEAVQVTMDRLGMSVGTQAGETGMPRDAMRKRWIKDKIYNRLPVAVGPSLYLAYRLFFRLGLLDGKTGIAFHVLQGFWYRLLVDLRRLELARDIAGEPTLDGKLLELERLTGLRLQAFGKATMTPERRLPEATGG